MIVSVNPAELELEPWPLLIESEGLEVDGAPGRWGKVLWRAPDRRAVLLIEELEPCAFRGAHAGEVIHLISGRVTCRPEGQPQYTMGPGDLGRFEAGLWDEWVVEETYRKVFYLEADRELPYPP